MQLGQFLEHFSDAHPEIAHRIVYFSRNSLFLD